MTNSRQLPIPPLAASDPRAIELLRAWAAGGKQHISIATKVWNDPASWGIMLVDLARHIAIAYNRTEGLDTANVLSRIKTALDLEWSEPTDVPEGELLKEE